MQSDRALALASALVSRLKAKGCLTPDDMAKITGEMEKLLPEPADRLWLKKLRLQLGLER